MVGTNAGNGGGIMTAWEKYAFIAAILITAGVTYYKNLDSHLPSDFKDAVSDISQAKDFDTSIPDFAQTDTADLPVPKAVAVKGYSKNHPGVNNPADSASFQAVEWVSIPGGKFAMGANDADRYFEDAKPIHEVAVKAFEMSKTLVTVEQYMECVNKGQCTEPSTTGAYCSREKITRCGQRQPVTCVDWAQANQYAKFKGARLPSESEWEYAAKSGGKDQKYPWGNSNLYRDKAVLYGDANVCEQAQVCSKAAGNTAQGLCDMAGLGQWVQDMYQSSYRGAPRDGGAFEKGDGSRRVVRGGASWNISDTESMRADYMAAMEATEGEDWNISDAKSLRTDFRNSVPDDDRSNFIGFRLARSTR